MKSEDYIYNTAAICEVLGIKRSWLYELQKQGLPRAARGKYHLPSVVQWFLAEKTGKGRNDLNDDRRKLIRQQTETHILENRRKRGDLFEAEAVRNALYETANLVATQLDAIEPRIGRFIPAEVRPKLRGELKAARTAIANHVETFASSRDSSRDHPAAA